MPLTGLLLAAGSSRRFGVDKLSRPLPDGDWVAVRSCRNLLMSVDRVLAVVKPGADELAEQLRAAGADVLACEEAVRGMGASLAFGVRSSCGETRGWLVALADMPWIKPETMRSVAGSIRIGSSVAAPAYLGRRGHPVGFSARHARELAALDGDEGANSVLVAHANELQLIEVDDPGVLLDIDLPQDLHLFSSLSRQAI